MHVTLVCIPAPHLLTTSTSLPLGSELPPLPDGIPVTLVCIPTLHLLTTSTSLPLGSELPPLPGGMPDACVHPREKPSQLSLQLAAAPPAQTPDVALEWKCWCSQGHVRVSVLCEFSRKAISAVSATRRCSARSNA